VLTEIFAVTHSLERAAALPVPAGWRPGDTVAVIGAGALGLAHAVKASLMGAGEVLVSDPSGRRVELAERVAGARPVQPGDEAAVVVNATGFPGSLAVALDLVRDGGVVIEVGAFVDMGGEPINPAVLCARNLTLFGVAGEDLVTYDGTLKLLDRHRHAIPFEALVSHRFEIARAAEAMQVALDADASAKVLIRPS
jgi:threonine dehydrogenase-like Zn-dependent dehydrogenase